MTDDIPVHTARIEIGFNRTWMRENPILAVEAIIRFIEQHPPEQYAMTVRRDYMPGMHFMLVATAKPNKGTAA